MGSENLVKQFTSTFKQIIVD